jgi:hypothetical protein
VYRATDKGLRTASLIRFIGAEDGLLSHTHDGPRMYVNTEGRFDSSLYFIFFTLFARCNFHELCSGLFQLSVLFLRNPLLLACPYLALAGALDQSTQLATSFHLIPRCDPTNSGTNGGSSNRPPIGKLL